RVAGAQAVEERAPAQAARGVQVEQRWPAAGDLHVDLQEIVPDADQLVANGRARCLYMHVASSRSARIKGAGLHPGERIAARSGADSGGPPAVLPPLVLPDAAQAGQHVRGEQADV